MSRIIDGVAADALKKGGRDVQVFCKGIFVDDVPVPGNGGNGLCAATGLR